MRDKRVTSWLPCGSEPSIYHTPTPDVGGDNPEKPPVGGARWPPGPLRSSPALAFLCAVAGQAALAPLARSPPRPHPVLARSKVAKVPLAGPCTPVPRARGERLGGRGMGSGRAVAPRAPRPRGWHPAPAPPVRLGRPQGSPASAPRLARPAPPPARTKAAPPRVSRAVAPFRGIPPPSRWQSLRETKARWRPRDKGAGGGGGGLTSRPRFPPGSPPRTPPAAPGGGR